MTTTQTHKSRISCTINFLGSVSCFCITFLSLSALSVEAEQVRSPVEIAKLLPSYQAEANINGTLSSVGSDTLNNLMTLWVENFRKSHSSVIVQVEGKGSSTAPPALISATAQLGPMSRKMKNSEIDEFEKRFGYKPTAIKVAVDALAVFVNRDNPLKSMTLVELDAVFSKLRRRGGNEDLSYWKDLEVGGIWTQKPISLYGRNSASGTNGYFKKVVLKSGDYKNEVKEQPGSSAVVQSITVDKFGIGYSGIGYMTSGVKAIPLALKEGSAPVSVNMENSYNGSYPLARFLYIYVNKKPGEPLDKLTKAFLKLVLSREGQLQVVKDGYFPIDSKLILKELGKLE